MDRITLLENHCSGYNLLTNTQKQYYSQQDFTDQLQKNETDYLKKLSLLIQTLPSRFWFLSYSTHRILISTLTDEYRNFMIDNIRELSTNNLIFKEMQIDINFQVLKKYCFGFKQFLSNHEQHELSKSTIAKDLTQIILENNLDQSSELIKNWGNSFILTDSYGKIINERATNYATNKITHLLKRTWFLNNLYKNNDNILHDLVAIEKHSLSNFFNDSINTINQPTTLNNLFLQKASLYLSTFIAQPLENFTQSLNLSLVELYNFNLYFAYKISKETLDSENHLDQLGYNELLNQYKQNMLILINDSLDKNYNQLAWQINPPLTKTVNILFAIKQNIFSAPIFSRAHTQAQEVADSLFLFNAAGGESELGFITNLWNVVRFKNMVKSGKNIAISFLSLFKPIYDEFVAISKNEDSSFSKLISYLTPIIIAVTTTLGLFIAACTALPILASTIPSILVMIPLIIVGLFAATCFIKTKQVASSKYHAIKNNDGYNVPAFQINPRMLEAFGEEKAETVKKLYVNEIKQTEKTLANLLKKKSKGVILSKELHQLNNIKNKKLFLTQEWLDIHENSNLGIDKLDKIVNKRFEANFIESSQEKLTKFKQEINQRVTIQLPYLFNQFKNTDDSAKKTNKNKFHFLRPLVSTHPIIQPIQNFNNIQSDYELMLEQHQLLSAPTL